MARMKQLALDIEESREADEDGIVSSEPVAPPSPAIIVENSDRLSD